MARAGAALAAVLLLLGACAALPTRALLGDVAATPARLTPNGDGRDDIATIKYSVSRAAAVKITLLDAAGRAYLLQQSNRPAGSYEAVFDGGAATGESEMARRALPAGEYTYLVEATAEGRREESRGQLQVADNDPTPLNLTDVRAAPQQVSPYDPQYAAQTRVSYRLNKAGTVTVYAVEPDGRRTRLGEPQQLAAGEHSHAWDGLIRNRVPAAGTYSLLVQARDAAGNVAEGAAPVQLAAVEEPDAAVLKVAFSPQKLAKGELLKVEITVKNTGKVPLRSQGPQPGYVYTTRDTFASVEGGRYAEASRLWRVGVDWSGSLGAEASRYPYRWGLGQDLAPGEQTTVVGYIRVLEDYPQMRLYGGLVFEQVKYQGDRLGQTVIEVGH
ncbi:MAG: flagellar hook assembly protein FlgD [Chloroflexota bacterium]